MWISFELHVLVLNSFVLEGKSKMSFESKSKGSTIHDNFISNFSGCSSSFMALLRSSTSHLVGCVPKSLINHSTTSKVVMLRAFRENPSVDTITFAFCHHFISRKGYLHWLHAKIRIPISWQFDTFKADFWQVFLKILKKKVQRKRELNSESVLRHWLHLQATQATL